MTYASVAIAGALFLAFELSVHFFYGQQLRAKFKAGGKVKAQDLNSTLWQASCRLVGMLHLVIQIPLAAVVLTSSDIKNRIYDTTSASSLMATVGAGYFLYDLFVCIFRWEGIAYLFHGMTCFTLFSYAEITGFLHYYVALFLLWELSTPFVYGRWYLYNLNLAHTKLYIINGLAMLVSFFCARNLLGAFMAIDFFRVSGQELKHPRVHGDAMPVYMIWLYRVACVSLSCLNAMWFTKMLKGALKVLHRTESTKTK